MIMKLTISLSLLSLNIFTHAAPKTRYSTITINPVPLSTTVTHYHHNHSFYPTGSDRPGLYNAYYNASANISLSYTLSYPTTKLPPSLLIFPQRSAQPSTSSRGTMTGVLGDPVPSLPPLPPLLCTPGELYCNSITSFSLCTPAAGGGSRYVFMGAVANGTLCDGARIGRADGGHCSPVGNLKCRGERDFFLCDEGMFIV